jgi:sulfur carrier protein ThiS
MKLKVKLYGTLGIKIPGYKPSKGLDIEIPDGSTVKDLLDHLEISEMGAAVVIVDGRVLKASDKVQDGLPVNVFQNIKGG